MKKLEKRLKEYKDRLEKNIQDHNITKQLESDIKKIETDIRLLRCCIDIINKWNKQDEELVFKEQPLEEYTLRFIRIKNDWKNVLKDMCYTLHNRTRGGKKIQWIYEVEEKHHDRKWVVLCY